MSDQPGTENFNDDLGSMSLDDGVDAGEGQPDLLDSSEGDNLPVSPPDLQPRNTEWGTTAEEQAQDETIDQRINQEVPDPNSAYGAPDNEGGLDDEPRVGGDDPDSIPAEEDFLGEPGGVDGVDDVDGGSLTAPDEGLGPDEEKTLVADEGDGARHGAPEDVSAEESAMHIVEE
ncbi:hypothetical protein N798_05740 [Knoellia flava TL1]|uniref:DUF5709 domain-containing protein n=2 Tax=Knoellia flava TaxID=913969 RepID=A0A8H9FT46_9MICO|nr:DUF5709 domain-containing protein [Knoellia flava]KGN33472.1 hypothetical protein N798_05740 [Knoellia flava TL1]GGB74003.1 hypothetical protein GCM10011314_11820 [Knoellia flava]